MITSEWDPHAPSEESEEQRDPWLPQPGFQMDALEARYFVDELFGGGNRGGGKTDWLLADFASDVKRYGRDWKGVLFRKTFSQFREIIDKSKELYHVWFPGAVFKEGTLEWHFPNGAKLLFFHMAEDSDADKHLGIQYTWIGWDELPHWPTPRPYNKLKACLRSPVKGIPKRIRSTGNPGGPGLGWIKRYFQIPNDPKDVGGELYTDPDTKMSRMFLRSTVHENKALLDADPNYIGRIKSATEGNPQLEEAWLQGNFNVFFGKFFTLFDPSIHRVDPISVLPDGKVPSNWRLYGSLDYGEASPTSFGLWAVDTESIADRMVEVYSGGLWVSEYAGRIRDLIMNCPYTGGRFPERVFADTSIFYTRTSANYGQMNRMVSDIFKKEAGLKVVPSNKNRLSGWRYLKEVLSWKKNKDGVLIQKPRLHYFPECDNFEREFENAVHAGDEDNPREDMNTHGEDHSCDDTRYFVMGALAGRDHDKIEGDSAPTSQWYRKLRRRNNNIESFMVPGDPVDLDHLIEDLVEEGVKEAIS